MNGPPNPSGMPFPGGPPSALNAPQAQGTTSPSRGSKKSSSNQNRPSSIYEMVMSQKQPPTHTRYNFREAMHHPVPPRDSSPYSLDQLTRRSLPFFLPWTPTAGPQEVPPDPSWLTNACAGKAVVGVIGGGMMGLLMGVFLGAMSDATPPVQFIAGKEVPQAPFREQLKVTMRATGEKAMYWCRSFAFITGVFGGSECLVEKYRGKHDVWNSVVSGCITGAALQAKQGPQSAAIGCGGFAAFSLVVDNFMGHY